MSSVIKEKRHGRSDSKVYRAWSNMLSRCYNQKHPAYQYYGGEGVRVCDEWRDFRNFIADMGEPPTRLHTLGRSGFVYDKEHCRWETRLEQANNLKNNRRITFNGRTQTIAEWARELNLEYRILYNRIYRSWSIERSFFEKPRSQTTDIHRSRTYRAWDRMMGRCYRERDPSYKSYGGRGIRVCARWHNLANFLMDMGTCPDGYELDRKDPRGDYGPVNCRWAAPGTGKRSNHRQITHDGLTLNLHEWSRRVDIPVSTIATRLRRGLSSAEALQRRRRMALPVV